MASMDLSSLTIPQLKAKCKELKLSGYSKLNKPALLQKLGWKHDTSEQSVSITKSFPVNVIPTADVSTHVPSIEGDSSSLTRRTGSTLLQENEPQARPTSLILQTRPPPTITTTNKRAADEAVAVKKKAKVALLAPSSNESAAQVLSRSMIPGSSYKGSIQHAVSSIPTLIKKNSVLGNSLLSMDSNTIKSKAALRSTRFLPLVPSQSTAAIVRRLSSSQQQTIASSLIPNYLELGPIQLLSKPLRAIGLPPSLKERDLVRVWSIALRLLDNEDRKQCVLVSRAFRHAVFHSALQIIKHDIGVRYLATISAQYQPLAYDCWPILLHYRAEICKRNEVYRNSFICRFFGDWDPISPRLWTSPDHDDQLTIALRYLSTRMWFCLCMNANDVKALRCSVVIDAQEIIKDEIWAVTVEVRRQRDHNSRECLYVLYDTCEVIGHPSPSKQAPRNASGLGMRSDWAAYVASRLKLGPSSPSLLSAVKWNNEEEYLTGMSRHWLSRIMSEGALGAYKRKVAVRYVLASVVGNSVSGTWMTSSHMAQVFAGTASETDIMPYTAKHPKPKVNFFLPAHHLVESVHFTTPKGQTFHPAIACIRTPDREYYILRDNGMTVGCEEDGIWVPWTEILRCDRNGLPI